MLKNCELSVKLYYRPSNFCCCCMLCFKGYCRRLSACLKFTIAMISRMPKKSKEKYLFCHVNRYGNFVFRTSSKKQYEIISIKMFYWQPNIINLCKKRAVIFFFIYKCIYAHIQTLSLKR